MWFVILLKSNLLSIHIYVWNWSGTYDTINCIVSTIVLMNLTHVCYSNAIWREKGKTKTFKTKKKRKFSYLYTKIDFNHSIVLQTSYHSKTEQSSNTKKGKYILLNIQTIHIFIAITFYTTLRKLNTRHLHLNHRWPQLFHYHTRCARQRTPLQSRCPPPLVFSCFCVCGEWERYSACCVRPRMHVFYTQVVSKTWFSFVQTCMKLG